jgi:hypothetical protein
MKRKSIYSILSWYKSDVSGLAHDNTVFAYKKGLWLFFDIYGIEKSESGCNSILEPGLFHSANKPS